MSESVPDHDETEPESQAPFCGLEGAQEVPEQRIQLSCWVVLQVWQLGEGDGKPLQLILPRTATDPQVFAFDAKIIEHVCRCAEHYCNFSRIEALVLLSLLERMAQEGEPVSKGGMTVAELSARLGRSAADAQRGLHVLLFNHNNPPFRVERSETGEKFYALPSVRSALWQEQVRREGIQALHLRTRKAVKGNIAST